jgi:hypothetical protein
MYKNALFTKTGSGQTWGKLKKERFVAGTASCYWAASAECQLDLAARRTKRLVWARHG